MGAGASWSLARAWLLLWALAWIVFGRRSRTGECGIRQVQSFSTEDLYITIAGEVPDFDPKERLKSKPLMLADKYSQYAGCAAQEAVASPSSKLPLKDNESYRSACIIGSGVGGLTTLEFSYKMLFKENKRATHPLTLLKAIGSSASAHVSIEYGIKGPTFGVVSACSTATHAIGLTYRMIREGLVDFGLAGAAEASLNWGATRAWQAMRVLSPDGLLPFAKRRNGTVLAEGAGILMLEEYEHAKARGAPILAELMGYGMTADAADMVNPSIDGASMAMQMALRRCRPGAERYRLRQRARHRDDRQRPQRDPRHQARVRQRRQQALDLLDQVDARPLPRRRRRHRGGGRGQGDRARNSCPPTSASTSRTRNAISTTRRMSGATREVNYAMSNSFAFGGLNAVLGVRATAGLGLPPQFQAISGNLVGHRDRHGNAAGHRADARPDRAADRKAGDSAHSGAAGDLLGHGAAHGAGRKRNRRQQRNYTLHGDLPQPRTAQKYG